MRTKRLISTTLCDEIELIRQRLENEYGVRELHRNEDAMGELISTILSQNTTDASSWQAYLELKRRFPTWDDVSAASPDEIADAIRVAGLANQKARAIRAALEELAGESLEALTALPVTEARARLTSIRGVGDKTASIVLLFALGMPAQPVDTHIERVSKRLGITNGENTAPGIQNVYEHCLPADSQTMYAFHVNMIQHGREICQARSPKCGMCVLNDRCSYYARSIDAPDPHPWAMSENAVTS